MTKKNLINNSDDKIDMFYGFWKYLGIFGSFILGVVLFWWGCNILINDFYLLRLNLGLIALLSLAPLFFGAVMAWLSFSEFLAIIRNQ